MAHYNAYDSFHTKKSQDKKERAKEKSYKGKPKFSQNFIVDKADACGTVIEVRYNDAYVLYNGKVIVAQLKSGINAVCNQVVFPGDKVIIEHSEEKFTIQNILKRTSILSRIKRDSTKLNEDASSIKNIATNINVAVIVVSANQPPLHPKFIDRYLMILQNSKIDSVICLNKNDLKTANDEEILNIYRKIGIPVIETSATNSEGINELKNVLRGKQAIFVGHSGVGKSSLTNALMESDDIKTSNVSEKSGKGRHTTTTSKFYIWDENSSIIDTPGIRSLDTSSFQPKEIQEYFQEFSDWSSKCKFSNCLHYNEPDGLCMVKQAVKSGIISKSRYESYIRILKDVMHDKEKDKNDDIER